jgi:hypothetical protein
MNVLARCDILLITHEVVYNDQYVEMDELLNLVKNVMIIIQ